MVDQGPSFESSQWNREDCSPAVTPGLLSGYSGTDFEGNPRPSKITYGLHWRESSYPTWNESVSYKVPSIHEVAELIDTVKEVFGFQMDTSINVFELLMSQLDSRASRSNPQLALRTLHADYIGGPKANFKQWYMSSAMDIADASSFSQDWLNTVQIAHEDVDKVSAPNMNSPKTTDPVKQSSGCRGTNTTKKSVASKSIASSLKEWDDIMVNLTETERLCDLIIYLSCWTEANQIRYMPECLAFIVKCARDHFYYTRRRSDNHVTTGGCFLDDIVTPLYECYRDSNFTYDHKTKQWVNRECDHRSKIGYDDMNQLFWSLEGIYALETVDKRKLHSYPRSQWYIQLQRVRWSQTFHKTYREARSSFHLITNFSRIWTFHISVFWMFLSFHLPFATPDTASAQDAELNYLYLRLFVASYSGVVGPFIATVSLCSEAYFVPRRSCLAQPVLLRTGLAVLAISAFVGLGSWNFTSLQWSLVPTTWTKIWIIGAFSLAIVSNLYYSSQPLAYLVGSSRKHRTRGLQPLSSITDAQRPLLSLKMFTGSFQQPAFESQLYSWSLMLMVLSAKLLESYFFLTLSANAPLKELRAMIQAVENDDPSSFGTSLRKFFPGIIMGSMILTDLILFFLDTYLWYVIFSTLASVCLCLKRGVSIWTPWKNIYGKLPSRIGSAILHKSSYSSEIQDYRMKVVWSSIIEAMYRCHLLSAQVSHRLISTIDHSADMLAAIKSTELTSEQYRRISYFAHSLTTPIPSPTDLECMPTFSVLIPHFDEKIILGLKETIAIDDRDLHRPRITILEYLQQLFSGEWKNFAEGRASSFEIPPDDGSDESELTHDIALKTLGFARSHPHDTYQTRKWCSMRMQTLYRTVAGFMNYETALKVLYMAENGTPYENADNSACEIDSEPSSPSDNLNSLISRKFRLVIAMQQYATMRADSLAQVNMLLCEFPNISIAFIDRDENGTYYSSLIDSSCPLLDDTRRLPRLKIRLSGCPILGDGKADNQNNALIYYRGEYIQLVDANQDNYLEECLKIRSVLEEFDESIQVDKNVYCGDGQGTIAIVGAREYIFSENIGVIGDIAAGKEQTFGTLHARSLAEIGMKLHYGHPDFLNGVFMTTRGGVSKAQGGLHLNEDIYAGMTAISRGGIIKHMEYFQCGKGRNLGFTSVLNFVAKLGAGMGEQILSREYFYMGSQLPVDRFFHFFYAHPGFHLNNVFINMSWPILILVTLWISCLSFVITENLNQDDYVDLGKLLPLTNWIKRCVLSIFIVCFVSLCPLFAQELLERGLYTAIARSVKQLVSLSMVFEIFVCRTYARAFMDDMSVGGAHYIPTGRGFAMTRAPFYQLYQEHVVGSISHGLKLLCLLFVASSFNWHATYLLFWVTVISLFMGPFLFNPHQFSRVDFFLDYEALLRWFFNHTLSDSPNHSWSSYIAVKPYKYANSATRPAIQWIYASKTLSCIVPLVVVLLPYLYLSFSRVDTAAYAFKVVGLRIVFLICVCLLPNAACLIIGWVLTVIVKMLRPSSATTMAKSVSTVCRVVAVMAWLMVYYLSYFISGCDMRTTILLLSVYFLSARFYHLVTLKPLSPQGQNGWWTTELTAKGWRRPIEFLAYFLSTLIEMCQYPYDFISCHFILLLQVPLVIIPFADQFHTFLLFWLRPSQTPDVSMLPFSHNRRRISRARNYCAVFFALVIILIAAILVPLNLGDGIKRSIREGLASRWYEVF